MGRELWELEDKDLDDAILDLLPGEEDEFDVVNIDFTTSLLEDDGEEMAKNIARTYNPKVGAPQEGQGYPELELGVSSLDLGRESDSNPKTPSRMESTSDAVSIPIKTPADGLTLPSGDVEMMTEQGKPLPPQPGLEVSDHHHQIQGVGLF